MEYKFSEPLSIDPETGLPKLPEGLAWNVDSYGMDRLVVEIHYLHELPNTWWMDLWRDKPRTLWMKYKLVSPDYADPTEEDLLNTTVRMYERQYDRYMKYKDVDKFVGLYPPKSIL